MPILGGSNDLYFASGIDNSGLKRDSQQAIGIISSMASQITRKDVFAGLAVAATLAFGKASSEIKKFSEEYEHSMKEVQTISSAVQQDFDGYSQAIVDLTKSVPQSANELSKAYYQIVSAGYDGAEGLNLLKVAAEGAVGGVSDVTTVADGVTTVLNAWKLSAAQANEVSDVFFNTVKLGKTTIGELSSNIAQVAPLASAYGVSFKQIAAATATLTKQGTSTAQAMTQLRQGLIAVNETLGEGWSKSMTLQEAFQQIADRAAQSGKDVKEFTGRVEGALAILATTGKNARGAAEDLLTYGDAAGAATEAFNTMVVDSVNQSKILKNNLQAALKPLGDFLSGKATEFAKNLNEAFDSGQIENFARVVAIGAASLVAYNLTLKAASISKISFLRAVVRAKNAMQAFNLVTKANPVGLIVTAITAATTAFLLFRNRTNEASKAFKDFATETTRQKVEMDALFGILEKATKGSDEYKEAISKINEKYRPYLTNLIDEKSSLQDIKKAHDEARVAMINRLTAEAQQSALLEAQNKYIEEQVRLKEKLYRRVSKESGLEAAGISTIAFDDFAKRYADLWKNVQKYNREGLTDVSKKMYQQMKDLKKEFADTYLGGDDRILTEILLDFRVNETDLDRQTEEIKALYGGVVDKLREDLQDITDGGGNGSSDSGGGFKILDLEELDTQLQAAEKAFAELDNLRKAGLEGESGDQYEVFTQYGANFEEYLAFMKNKYQDFGDRLKVINLAIADQVVEDLRLVEESRKRLADETKEHYEEVFDDLEKSMDSYIKAMEESLDLELSKESVDPVDKVFKFLNQIFTESELKDLEDNLNQFGRTVSNFGNLIGRFSGKAGEATRLFGQLISNSGAIVQFIASGSTDIFTLLNGIIGMGDAIIGFFQTISGQAKRDAIQAEQIERQAYRIAKAVEDINKALDEQYDLLNRLEGHDWLIGAGKTIGQINDAIESIKAQLHALDISFYLPGEQDVKVKVDTSGFDTEDFENALRNYGDLLSEETRTQIQDYLDQIDQLSREAEELQIQIKLETVGFTFDSLVDDVLSMFQQMEDGAVDFGATFQDIMQKALFNAFQQKYVTGLMQEFYDALYAALESPTNRRDRGTDSFGNIDANEYSQLEDLWNFINESISGQYEGMIAFLERMGADFSETTTNAEDPNSLRGAISRGLTEETGTVLAGRMNNMMLTMQDLAGFQAQMVDFLSSINSNTSYNRHLAQMRDDLREIRNQLSA